MDSKKISFAQFHVPLETRFPEAPGSVLLGALLLFSGIPCPSKGLRLGLRNRVDTLKLDTAALVSGVDLSKTC